MNYEESLNCLRLCYFCVSSCPFLCFSSIFQPLSKIPCSSQYSKYKPRGGSTSAWHSSIRRPIIFNPNYRSSYNFSQCSSAPKLIVLLVLLLFVSVFLIYSFHDKKGPAGKVDSSDDYHRQKVYDSDYPLSKPIIGKNTITFNVALVADLDTNSKLQNASSTWFSIFRSGHLTLNRHNRVSINFDGSSGIRKMLTSNIASGGRGMELSDLITFNGHLFSIDDRTGIVYKFKELEKSHNLEMIRTRKLSVFPWLILTDGDGEASKGFKGEWMTVKDGELIVGSSGKEWTDSTGQNVFSHDPMFVKFISVSGEVKHVDWKDRYESLMKYVGVNRTAGGYMIHEAVVWSSVHREWVFAPRRISINDHYDDVSDEHRGSNMVICASENFTEFRVIRVPFKTSREKGTRGFSSIKFVPQTQDELIVALRSEEVSGETATYISVFKVKSGEIVHPEILVEKGVKYEGIDFI